MEVKYNSRLHTLSILDVWTFDIATALGFAEYTITAGYDRIWDYEVTVTWEFWDENGRLLEKESKEFDSILPSNTATSYTDDLNVSSVVKATRLYVIHVAENLPFELSDTEFPTKLLTQAEEPILTQDGLYLLI